MNKYLTSKKSKEQKNIYIGIGIGLAIAFGCQWFRNRWKRNRRTHSIVAPGHKKQTHRKGHSDVIFIGTGNSSTNPWVNCILACGGGFFKNKPYGGCEVCQRGREDMWSKDTRGNPSLMVVYRGTETDEPIYVLIDAGKSLKEGVLKWFPEFRIPGLDAVILTHGHMDAIGGIDDLRMMCRKKPLPVYQSKQTEESTRKMFDYLYRVEVDPKKNYVASLDWKTFDPDSKFSIEGLNVEVLDVEHGKNKDGSPYICNGFAFGRDDSKFVYLSDVSHVPDNVMIKLKNWDIQILVVDCLFWENKRAPTHFNFTDAMQLVNDVEPFGKTYFVGMSHWFSHDRDNRKLLNEYGGKVELAFDGLRLTGLEF